MLPLIKQVMELLVYKVYTAKTLISQLKVNSRGDLTVRFRNE